MELLEKYPGKIDWVMLSTNENAFQLLEKNQGKISWYFLSENPGIFPLKINYRNLKDRMDIIREELIMKCMHPSRLERWIEMGGNIDDF